MRSPTFKGDGQSWRPSALMQENFARVLSAPNSTTRRRLAAVNQSGSAATPPPRRPRRQVQARSTRRSSFKSTAIPPTIDVGAAYSDLGAMDCLPASRSQPRHHRYSRRRVLNSGLRHPARYARSRNAYDHLFGNRLGMDFRAARCVRSQCRRRYPR